MFVIVERLSAVRTADSEAQLLFTAAAAVPGSAERRQFMLDAVSEATSPTDVRRRLTTALPNVPMDTRVQELAGLNLAVGGAARTHALGRTVGPWKSPNALKSIPFWSATYGSMDAFDAQWDRATYDSRLLAEYEAVRRASDLTKAASAISPEEFAERWPNVAGRVIQRPLDTLTPTTGEYGRAFRQGVPDGSVVMFVTASDDRVRPNHSKLNGFKFRTPAKNDSLWAPKGLRCRCTNKIMPSGTRLSGRVPAGISDDPGYADATSGRYRPNPWTIDAGLARALPKKADGLLARLGQAKVDLTKHIASLKDSAAYQRKNEGTSTWAAGLLAVVTGPLDKVIAATLSEKAAVGGYLGDRASEYSLGLREGVKAELRDSVKLASSGLNKAPTVPGKSIRVAFLPSSVVDAYRRKVGSVIGESAFLSTFKNETAAREAGATYQFWVRAVLGKEVPLDYVTVTFEITGKSARDVSGGAEVTFAPGTRFKITSVTGGLDTAVVRLKEVEPSTSFVSIDAGSIDSDDFLKGVYDQLSEADRPEFIGGFPAAPGFDAKTGEFVPLSVGADGKSATL